MAKQEIRQRTGKPQAALLGLFAILCAWMIGSSTASAEVKISVQGTADRVEFQMDWPSPVEAAWRKDDGDIVITFSKPFEPQRLDEVVATQADWVAFAIRGYDSVLFVLRDGVEGRVTTEPSIVRLELQRSPLPEGGNRQKPADVEEASIRLELARARLLQAQSRLLEARRGIRMLLDRHPDRIDLLLQLASIEGDLGRPEFSLLYYNRILELEPDNKDIREAKTNLSASLSGAGEGGGSAPDGPGSGRVEAETTIQQIRESDRQVISIARGEVQATQAVELKARVERRDVKSRSIRGPGGRTAAFTGRKIRGQVEAVMAQSGIWQASAKLYGAEKTVGAGAEVRLDLAELIGSQSAITSGARFNEPYWGLIEGVVHNATRHRAFTTFTWQEGPFTGSIGLNLNQYGIDGTVNAAQAVGVPITLTYSPTGEGKLWSGLALSYLLDPEYLTRQKVKFDTGSDPYRPLGLVTREIHSFQAAYDRKLLERLTLAGFIGYSWDRFNSDGFFGGLSLAYEPFSGVELGLRFVQNITSSQGGDDVVQQFGGHVAFEF
ncbi:MAG: hypothetical protein ACPGOV_12960 [Magnetovibrionaceae bacterium]